MSEPRLVMVTWIDSGLARSNGWEKPAEIIPQMGVDHMTANTVGFLIHETDEILIVAQTEDLANGAYLNAQAIYVSNIIGRRALS